MLSAAANGACEQLSLDLPADRDGYVQVFVANESNANVWFDDLTLIHSVAPIVQENHYDPFGLHLGGLVERQGTPEHPFQYNAGSEKQPDAVGYGYSYATDWRGYDPQLGRFHGIDALAHQMPGINPYQYGYNNPVMFNDPTGENPLLGLAIGAVAGAAVGGTVSAIQGNGFWSGAWKGALIGAGVGAAVGWGVQAWGGGSSALGTPGYMTPAAPQDFLTSRGVGGGVGEVAQKASGAVGVASKALASASTSWPMPLTKVALEYIVSQLYHYTGGTLQNEAGRIFEEGFDRWKMNQSTTYQSNDREFPTLGVPGRNNVEPDGVDVVKDLRGRPNTPPLIPSGSWYEVKATDGTITGSSYNNQIKGFYNALRTYASSIGVPRSTPLVLTFATTYDASLGTRSIGNLSRRYNVHTYQQLAWYRSTGSGYEVAFSSPFNLLPSVIPPLSGYVPLR